jgi:hypothetical protein
MRKTLAGGPFDLREHFGIWDHCGNTRFFKKQNKWSEIYLNPLDGLLIAAHRDRLEGEPSYTFVVRDARKAENDEVKKAFRANEPWVKRAVEKFFYHQALGWALDAIKEHAGRPPMPGDRDLGNFLEFYKSGAGDREKYLNEGGSGDLNVPFLEETLEAILRTMGSMDGITVDYGRGLSQTDLDEALGSFGILECA